MKSRISCEFFRHFLLRIFNISRKIAKFDIESDIQNARFSEKLDKNNWTQRNGLVTPWVHDGRDTAVRLTFLVSGLHLRHVRSILQQKIRKEIHSLREVVSGSGRSSLEIGKNVGFLVTFEVREQQIID